MCIQLGPRGLSSPRRYCDRRQFSLIAALANDLGIRPHEANSKIQPSRLTRAGPGRYERRGMCVRAGPVHIGSIWPAPRRTDIYAGCSGLVCGRLQEVHHIVVERERPTLLFRRSLFIVREDLPPPFVLAPRLAIVLSPSESGAIFRHPDGCVGHAGRCTRGTSSGPAYGVGACSAWWSRSVGLGGHGQAGWKQAVDCFEWSPRCSGRQGCGVGGSAGRTTVRTAGLR